MKSILGIGLIGALLMGAIQSAAAESVASDREADHTALRVLLADVTTAVNKQDLDALASCFAEEFVFTAVDQTVLTNVVEIKTYYRRMLDKETSPVKSLVVKPKASILTRFIDENTGYCYGTSDDEYVLRRNGRKVTMPSHWTAVVIKENGVWKVAVVHAGVNFLDNPVLDARSMSIWRKMYLGAGFGKYPGED